VLRPHARGSFVNAVVGKVVGCFIKEIDMKTNRRVAVLCGLVISAVAMLALAAQDKYSVKAPAGLAFFRIPRI